jgi:hypothetical protein
VIRDFETSLTAKELRRRFRYVKSTGLFIRKIAVTGWNGGVQDPVGSIAGCLSKSDGYVYTAVEGRQYLVHRLAVLYVTGEWPKNEVDHRNGIRHDNRYSNLRQVTVNQNRQNSLGQRKRKGPYPGVYEVERAKTANKFVAQIKKDGKVHYLGTFDSDSDARKARVKAEVRMFGAYAGSVSRGRF